MPLLTDPRSHKLLLLAYSARRESLSPATRKWKRIRLSISKRGNIIVFVTMYLITLFQIEPRFLALWWDRAIAFIPKNDFQAVWLLGHL